MKNKLKVSILYFFLLTSPFAIAQEFESGSNVINLGIGLGGNFGSFNSSSVSPGFSLSYERGIWDIGSSGVIGLGAYIGRKSYKNELLGVSSKWSYTTVGVRGAYHYNGLEVENLDVYGGAMLGIQHIIIQWYWHKSKWFRKYFSSHNFCWRSMVFFRCVWCIR